MSNEIDKTASEPLGFKDLKAMLGKDAPYVNFLVYNSLKNKGLGELFGGKHCCIVLLQNQRKGADPVGHFIVLINRGNTIEHFDPYGFSIEQEMHITQEPGYLSSILEKSGKQVIESKYKFQGFSDDVETCGRWCVARIKMMNYDLNKFKAFFKEPISTMDDKVTLLTFFK